MTEEERKGIKGKGRAVDGRPAGTLIIQISPNTNVDAYYARRREANGKVDNNPTAGKNGET